MVMKMMVMMVMPVMIIVDGDNTNGSFELVSILLLFFK